MAGKCHQRADQNSWQQLRGRQAREKLLTPIRKMSFRLASDWLRIQRLLPDWSKRAGWLMFGNFVQSSANSKTSGQFA